MQTFTIKNLEHWRTIARWLIAAEQSPPSVRLVDHDQQQLMFDATPPSDPPRKPFQVPREFLRLAEQASYHRNENRWNRLYRVLWRLTHGEPHLLEIITDEDVDHLMQMEKQVRRDAHKMKAFVRFRQVAGDDQEHFVAWHRPDHRILRKVAPFFSRRFRGMNWTILTPDESVAWDQSQLHYGPGAPRGAAPNSDQLEDLWRTYYGSIFNPARVKIRMMKSEMPVRHWPTLPETQIIPELLAEAPLRVNKMITESEGFEFTAEHYLQRHDVPMDSLEQLAQVAAGCTACDLYHDATQTVFGAGPADAEIVLVGEQPGDQEDLAGEPFVGPAGEVLNKALQAAGIDRKAVYLTNIVKHFKHSVSPAPRGKRRLHKRPNAREIRCCKPWFAAEWVLLRHASVLVCLGATAAGAIVGPDFQLTRRRGRIVASNYCPRTIATWHPSAILRARDDPMRQQKMSQLVADLTAARAAVVTADVDG